MFDLLFQHYNHFYQYVILYFIYIYIIYYNILGSSMVVIIFLFNSQKLFAINISIQASYESLENTVNLQQQWKMFWEKKLNAWCRYMENEIQYKKQLTTSISTVLLSTQILLCNEKRSENFFILIIDFVNFA